MRIPVQSSVLVHQRHRYEFGDSPCDGWWLWWRDTLKVQTAISRHHVMHELWKRSSCSLSSDFKFPFLLYFPRISRMFSKLVICTGFLLIFGHGTTRLRQSWRSLRQLLFLLKRQLLPLCFDFITQLFQCSTAKILFARDKLAYRTTPCVIYRLQGLALSTTFLSFCCNSCMYRHTSVAR